MVSENWLDLATAVILALGLGVTVWQIGEANKTLLAGNAYTIHKDARGITDDALRDTDFLACISPATADKACEGVVRLKAISRMSTVFNFYYSVYRLARSGGVGGDFINDYKNDLCTWFKVANISSFAEESWRNLLRLSGPEARFEQMRTEWCG